MNNTKKLTILMLLFNLITFSMPRYRPTIKEHAAPAIFVCDIKKLDNLIKNLKIPCNPPLFTQDFNDLANVDYMDLKNNTILTWALFTGRSDIAKKLLDLRANPNLIGSLGAPIHLAADMYDFEMVKDLINAGADPNVVDEQNLTVLEKARSSLNLHYLWPIRYKFNEASLKAAGLLTDKNE